MIFNSLEISMGCTWSPTKTTNQIESNKSAPNQSVTHLNETIQREATMDLLAVPPEKPDNESRSLELITNMSNDLVAAVFHDCMEMVQQTSENEYRSTRIQSAGSNKQDVNHPDEKEH